MKQRTHGLRINVTATATWAQMLDESGAPYMLKNTNSVFGEVEALTAANLGPQNGTVSIAFSAVNPPVNSGMIVPGKVLADNGGDIERTALRILRAGEGIWVMATATNCNMVAAATVREISQE